MTVSFSGTRSGMTAAQKEAVLRLLQELLPDTARAGMCLGSDDDFVNLCHGLVPRPQIIGHPGVSAKGGPNDLRSYNPHYDAILAERTHFARNRDLTDLGDVLIATPYQSERQSSGGTWYTVSQMEKRAKRTYVVKPDGSLL